MAAIGHGIGLELKNKEREMVHWQPGVTLSDVEQQVIEKCLQYFQGNKTSTAKSLGVSIRTIDNKLIKYKKQRESDEEATAKDKSQAI